MATETCLSRSLPVRQFGRKGLAAAMPTEARPTRADDLKLFALTFAGGFLFMAVFLA